MVFSRELPQSFGDALRVCREILSANHELLRKGSLDSEAEQLVIGAHRVASGSRLSRAEFFSRLRDRLPEASAERLLVLAGRRAEGVPLQHLLGLQVFLDHDYAIDNSTLIPRPETEGLVLAALAGLKEPGLGFEIGLGSGVISIELLNAFRSLRMIATEISESAIALAKKNAAQILGDKDAARLEIRKPASASQVLEPFRPGRADFLISNPPYLDEGSPEEAEPAVLAYEPRAALFPEGGDPLRFYREIAENAGQLLNPGGTVFLELASERARETARLFEGGWEIRILNDLAGRPRVLIARKNELKERTRS